VNKGKKDRPLFISTVFRLLRFKVIAQIASRFFGSYEQVWDALAMTERNAMDAALAGVKDEKEFNLAGERTAGTLKEFITAEDVVLDVGCGIGRIEKSLAEYCAEIHGVDVSKRMVKLARKRLKGFGNVYIHKNNGRDLSSFPNEKFDFVFSVLVLQHLEKEDAVFYLYEIHRVLKPNRKLYFTVPNFFDERNFRTFMDKYVKNPSSRTAIKMRFYCPEEVKKILTSIGFSIVSFRVDTDIDVLAKKSL
jgi:ubiquinone/menaquinone biosynthesis C-methylase UbiE